jgi:hypothetical protein
MDRKPIIGVAAMLIVAVMGAWALGWFGGGNYSDDPAVAELERARDEALAKHDTMTDEQKREQRRAIESRAQGLTPEQRMALWESSAPLMVPLMARQFEKRYDDFMKLSPEEQRKELDKRIDEMEQRMKAGNGPGGPDGPGRGDGNRPPIDAKKADEFRKKMLDWTTPEQRAKFENGINLFNERRKERGLEPINPRPGGGVF